MRIPRIYHPETISQLGALMLSDDAAGHIGRVLRMKEGQEVLLFDGSGAEFPATITNVSKKSVEVESYQDALSVALSPRLICTLAKSSLVAIRWSSPFRSR